MRRFSAAIWGRESPPHSDRVKPLLGQRHLSKSAVSRYAVICLDGSHLKVRLARRVVSVPVLAALGVGENGQKCVQQLRLAASEAEVTWGAVSTDFQQGGLAAPLLLVFDGNAGSKTALKQWDGLQSALHDDQAGEPQAHCPHHARAEMKRDYDRILYAEDGLAGRAAYDAFVKKWTTLCPAVANSLQEAGSSFSLSRPSPRRRGHRFGPTRSRILIASSSWDENAGVLQHRRRRADRALRPGRLRADSTAKDRWLHEAAVISREGVEESR